MKNIYFMNKNTDNTKITKHEIGYVATKDKKENQFKNRFVLSCDLKKIILSLNIIYPQAFRLFFFPFPLLTGLVLAGLGAFSVDFFFVGFVTVFLTDPFFFLATTADLGLGAPLFLGVGITSPSSSENSSSLSSSSSSSSSESSTIARLLAFLGDV